MKKHETLMFDPKVRLKDLEGPEFEARLVCPCDMHVMSRVMYVSIHHL